MYIEKVNMGGRCTCDCTEWLFLGLYSNMFALVTAIYGSFLVIYTSTNAINMVLNSMSLYFIMELDTMMVDQADYASMCTLLCHEISLDSRGDVLWTAFVVMCFGEGIKRFMDEKRKFVFEDWYDDDWFDETSGEIQFRTICGLFIAVDYNRFSTTDLY